MAKRNTRTRDVNRRTHRLQEARFVPSPHHNERPTGMAIDVVVIHAISLPPEQFGGSAIEQLFCGTLDHTAHPSFADLKDLRVSAHLLIRRDGEVLQFVPFDKRAWHAGESQFQGRHNVNDFSIGIELEGSDQQPFTDMQYETLAEVSAALLRAYPEIRPEAICGHHEIAPLRKTDPGPHFDWRRYRADVAQQLKKR